MMRAKIFAMSLIFLLIFSSILYTKEKYIKSWQDYFPDPIERIYIIMKDDVIFRQTNYEERLVWIGAGILENSLKKKAYKIKDISTIIHNHRFERKFSPADWKFYGDLKKRGFEGLFLIYCHMTNKVYNIEGKNR